MLRLTVSLSLVLGCAVVAGGIVPPVAVQAADPTEDPVAEWTKSWDRALKESAGEYVKLADKYRKDLEATAAYIIRFALRYQPDDEKTRAYLGYVKVRQPDGAPAGPVKWEKNDVVADKIRELADLKDPKKSSFKKDKDTAERAILLKFRGLAGKATENGAAKDVTPDAKKAWDAKAAMAWERVLELDDGSKDEMKKDFEAAHVALKHPKYEGKYVSPFKLLFAKVRDARNSLGLKEKNDATKIAPCAPCDPDGMFVQAGLKGGGAKSTHFVVNAVYGNDCAKRLVQISEAGLNDVVAVYGFPDNLKERVSFKFNILGQGPEGEAQYHKFLEQGAGWKPAEVQKYLDAHFGTVTVNNELVGMMSSGGDADDTCVNTVAAILVASNSAMQMARADLGSSVRERTDDWLWISMGYDVTKRLLKTNSTAWGAFGRYGDTVEGRPGEDKWLELARRLVIADDDVPLKKLWRLKLNKQEFKAPELLKGWALLQFVFEKNAENKEGQKFIWNALANGTAKAVADVYGHGEGGEAGATTDGSDADAAMDKLDAEYREWIVKSY